MPFINPWVFWTGLGAVSIPILIHLLNRRRFRVKDWAAMKFLLESIRKNRRRLRVEELILLALRCLAILLLALGVARFTGCSPAKGSGAEDGAGTSVYILDDSLSMAQKSGVGTLFTAACADLAGELEHTPATSQVAILPGSLAKARAPWFNRNFLTDPKTLSARIRALEVSDWRMSLAEALSAAGDQFRGVTGPKRLYVLSDFRRVDLVGDEQVNPIKEQFARLRKQDVEVVAMDYGRDCAHNLTIQEISLLDKFAVAKAPLRVSVTVRNNGAAGASEVELRPSARLTSGGGVQNVTLPVQVIHDIPAGQQVAVEFQVVCQEPGPAVISAALPADELVEDNTASLALEVRKFVRVLVVDGQPDLSDPEQSESYYFCKAVDPKADSSYGVKPEVVSEEGLSGVNLEDYDVVVLMNVARLLEDFGSAAPARPASQPTPVRGATTGPSEVAKSRPPSGAMDSLERYVRQGGGLLTFAGPHVDVNYYNEFLWGQGTGLLPLRMGATMGRGEPNFVRLDAKSIGPDRCFQLFQGEGAAYLGMFRFFRYLEAQESSALAMGEAGAPRILARFADGRGSPAVAARSFGKGTSMMFYSTGSMKWSDWPTDVAEKEQIGSFAPVMYETILSLARPQRPQTAEAGQPIVVELPRVWADATATLRTPRYPKEEEVVLTRPVEDKTAVLKYELPTSAGVYSLRLKRPGTEEMQIFYARNPDPAEGELKPGGQTALTAALGSEDFVYRPVKSGDAFGLVEAQTKKEYWKYAVAALLAVLALEVFLGQRFGHYTAGGRGQTQ
jgi:hypothetical protein